MATTTAPPRFRLLRSCTSPPSRATTTSPGSCCWSGTSPTSSSTSATRSGTTTRAARRGVVCGLGSPSIRTPTAVTGSSGSSRHRDRLLRQRDPGRAKRRHRTQLAARWPGSRTTRTHEIQLCLRYHECGTEPVPVLYDECGCDDDRACPTGSSSPSRSTSGSTPRPPADLGRTASGPAATTSASPTPRICGAQSDRRPALRRGRSGRGARRRSHVEGDPSPRTISGRIVRAFDLSPSGSHLYAVRDDGAGGLLLTVISANDFSVS